MESLTFFGVSVEHFGVLDRLFGHFVLMSFRRYGGILSFTCRRRMISCWRRRAVSATRWDLLLERSVSVKSSSEVVSGVVQASKR